MRQTQTTAKRLGAIALVGLDLVAQSLIDLQNHMGEKSLGAMAAARLLEARSRASVIANGGRPVDAERPTTLIVNVSLQRQPRYASAEGIEDAVTSSPELPAPSQTNLLESGPGSFAAGPS